jgi:two-component system NtrC family response regulator
MDTILIVDDEKNYPPILSAVLQGEGFETLTANSGKDAIEIIQDSDIDLVLTDMKMPNMNGIELLENIKAKDLDLPVIMMTAHGTVDKAVEAMQKGAYSYILKPFDNQSMILYVKKALSTYHVIKENRLLRSNAELQYSFDNIIGKSKSMQDMFTTIKKIAPSKTTVLIEGDSGTGKELVAKSIHFNSTRRNAPFVAVNCSALADSLLENELFGHEKGAFTGAVAKQKGRFELADGGTLFLDEISEISHNVQVKLLRVLQEKVFERVGGINPVSVDIRIIAATNKNLKEEMKQGRFREDLYYRLKVLSIYIPPLKQRKEDIRLLTSHFIKKYSSQIKSDTPVTGVSTEVERLLYEYNWPGNVRELENVIESAVILCSHDTIKVTNLPNDFKDNLFDTLHIDGIPANATLNQTLDLVEQKMIQRAMKITNHVQSHAAQLLGIGKSGLNQKIKKFKMEEVFRQKP